MDQLNYRYEFGENLIVIENLQNSYSVFVHLEEVLGNIEAEVGPIGGTPILCERLDGYWDLIVAKTKGEAQIYTLNALNLTEAKVKLGKLLSSGRNLGIFS